MKKVLLIAALIVSGTVATFAQTTAGPTTLTLNVADMRTIVIDGTSAPVFTLSAAADYLAAASSTGLSAVGTTTLKVQSRAGYKVKASTLAAGFTQSAAGTGSGNVTSIDPIYLALSMGSATTTTTSGSSFIEATPTFVAANTKFNSGGTMTAPIASTSSNDGGTLGTTFPVSYSILDFPQGVNLQQASYTTTVTYTIEAN